MSSPAFTTTIASSVDPLRTFAVINDVRRWWSGEIEGPTAELGDVFSYRHGDLHHSVQRITESVAGERVVWTIAEATLSFVADVREWTGTSIVFEISPASGGGSTVVFTHVGLSPALECFDACSGAWNHYVGESLRSHLVDRPAAPQPEDPMTENPPATIEPETFTVRRTIRIDATPDAVWRAITEPALISQWFGAAEFTGFGVGSTGTLTWDDYGSVPVRIEAIDAPHSITYRWSPDDWAGTLPAEVDEVRSTVFTFTIEAVRAGTQLTVVETGFETASDPAALLEDHRGGWITELDELVALLEGAA